MNDSFPISELRRIETEHHCQILFAVEAGNRAWGIPSADSRREIRFIYAQPLEWYLYASSAPKDEMEFRLPEGELTGWELKKTLGLFRSCNLPLNEWLGSPIVHQNLDGFSEKMKELIPDFFNPVRAAHTYLMTARNALDKISSSGEINFKRLFGGVRALLCAQWSLDRLTMPPSAFDLLPLPAELSGLILSLKMQKAKSPESLTLPFPEIIRHFWQETEEKIKIRLNTPIEIEKGNPEKLDLLLRSFLIPSFIKRIEHEKNQALSSEKPI